MFSCNRTFVVHSYRSKMLTRQVITQYFLVPIEKPPEKAVRTERPEAAEEIKPRTREWEKHKAPWMEELKLNQAKKTSFTADGKARASADGLAGKAQAGSTDRYYLYCLLDVARTLNV